MTKLIYLANIRLPTEKAHGLQIMKTCEALAVAGQNVELWVPRRFNHIKENPFAYYRVAPVFTIKKLWTIDLVFLGRWGFILQSLIFAKWAFWLIVFSASNRKAVIYSRDEMALLLPTLFGWSTVWEAHQGQTNWLVKSLISWGVKVVAISRGLQSLYQSLGAKNILVAPDAVDIEEFNLAEDKMVLRRELGLPEREKLVLYTGHLYAWKGADVLAQAATDLIGIAKVVLVGGTDSDLINFRARYGGNDNLMIVGQKPHALMPKYLTAADVLVIPNSAKEPISRLYTSPMKLFEYLASGTPIVATDLPSLREILNEANVLFAPPDDAAALAHSIERCLVEVSQSQARAKQARRDVAEYSWLKRGQKLSSLW